MPDYTRYNKVLRQFRPGLDTVFVDLDILDQNIATIQKMVGPQFSYRTVTKGLPCIGLIDYIMMKNHSPKLMTFSEGVLDAVLNNFSTQAVDVMQGREMPVAGVKRLLNKHSLQSLLNVRWIVDTIDMAQQYAALNLPLKVCVELECGVMRGGPTTPDELLAILKVIANSKMVFSGFMGYDGQVIYAPLTAQIPNAPFIVTSDQEFINVNQKYDAFIAAAKAAYPQWIKNPHIVFNGGGSTTLNYYSAKPIVNTQINDISFGIGYLCPSNYAQWLEAFGLVNACYCVTFVNKVITPAQAPFEPGYFPALVAAGNPMLQTEYYVNSGAFPGARVYPGNPDPNNPTTPALIDNPFVPNDPSGELFSNEQQFFGPTGILNIEDYVFFRPYESSAVAWLGTLIGIRGDHVESIWSTITEQPNTK
jgi:hypothetical protein